jgi:hypothetical protein
MVLTLFQDDAILGHSFREPSESFFEPVGGNTVTMRDAYRSTVEILPPPISSVKVLPHTYRFVALHVL